MGKDAGKVIRRRSADCRKGGDAPPKRITPRKEHSTKHFPLHRPQRIYLMETQDNTHQVGNIGFRLSEWITD
jgi:hypothetical protein